MGKEVKQVEEKAEDKELLKSIDEQIDALFVDETPAEEKSESDIEKGWGSSDQEGSAKAGGYDYNKPGPQSSLMKDGSSADDPKAPKTADEGEKPKKAKLEAEGERGRPKDVQDVPNVDKDGKRAKGYDHIQEPNSKTPAVSPKGTMVKSESAEESDEPAKFEVSEEDYKFLQKAKQEKEESEKEEQLRKAREEQADLIKSAVVEATKPLQDENEELRKALTETRELVKSIAKRPQRRKSVDNIQAIEKSFGENGEGSQKQPESFSKSEMMDAAEALYKSNEITLEQCIELDDTGSILNPVARKKVESYLKTRG